MIDFIKIIWIVIAIIYIGLYGIRIEFGKSSHIYVNGFVKNRSK